MTTDLSAADALRKARELLAVEYERYHFHQPTMMSEAARVRKGECLTVAEECAVTALAGLAAVPSVDVERVAKIIDSEAWDAITDGRDKPDTLWHLRRQFAVDKAEAILNVIRSTPATPDAREEALEEAAQIAESCGSRSIAYVIRSLKPRSVPVDS